MPEDLIRYDLLVQDALKGVVRKVLAEAGKDGLPGEHHFYVSFRTDFPGVRLSSRLREKYPQEMTIVLQHQFWDLGVTDHAFEVGLSFSGVPERLLVPFDALTGFFDPSVQFGLKFEAQGPESEGEPAALPSGAAPGAGSEPAELPPPKPAVPVTAKTAAPRIGARSAEPEKALPKAEKPERPEKPARAEKAKDRKEEKEETVPGTGQVVSLDSFRKKS